MILLGANKEDIGTHSRRKGSPTYVLGMIEGPNPVQVYLRSGWSLGNVQDRYIFAGITTRVMIIFDESFACSIYTL